MPSSAARSERTKTIVTLAMLTALSYAAMVVCKIIPPVGGFLSFDLKATVIAIGGFIYGPISSLLITIVVSLLEAVTVSDTGPVGLLMNVLATASFVCPAVFFYKRRHTLKAAVIGLIVGVLTMTVIMLLWNYIVTPIYYKMPRELVIPMLPTLILPFNLVKGAINAALVMLLYKPVVGALRRAHLVPESHFNPGEKPSPARRKWGPTIIALLVLITGVLLALAMLGKL